MSEKAILYTHPTCELCETVRLDLAEKGTEYDEIDLAKHPEKWADLEKLTKGERITPVLYADGKVTIGYKGIGCSFYDFEE